MVAILSVDPCGDREKHRTDFSVCMCRNLAGANRLPSWVRKYRFCVASQVCQRKPISMTKARATCKIRVGSPPVPSWASMID